MKLVADPLTKLHNRRQTQCDACHFQPNDKIVRFRVKTGAENARRLQDRKDNDDNSRYGSRN